jgi:hypothetical protein
MNRWPEPVHSGDVSVRDNSDGDIVIFHGSITALFASCYTVSFHEPDQCRNKES